jgi:hypothetical protein
VLPLYYQTTTEHLKIKIMNIEQLNEKKSAYREEVNEAISLKKKLYSNIDISQPMSEGEKELTRKIASLWSEINNIVRQIQEISK